MTSMANDDFCCERDGKEENKNHPLGRKANGTERVKFDDEPKSL
jgi:hypothetical protein